MTFVNVMQWALQAQKEERAALGELLGFMEFNDSALKVAQDKPKTEAKIHPAFNFVEDAKGDRRVWSAKRGHMVGRIVKATVKKGRIVKMEPDDIFTPKSPFVKKWWGKLSRATMPLSPEGLATLAGNKSRTKEVSASLSTLFKRGLVRRKRGEGRGYLYFVKEG